MRISIKAMTFITVLLLLQVVFVSASFAGGPGGTPEGDQSYVPPPPSDSEFGTSVVPAYVPPPSASGIDTSVGLPGEPSPFAYVGSGPGFPEYTAAYGYYGGYGVPSGAPAYGYSGYDTGYGVPGGGPAYGYSGYGVPGHHHTVKYGETLFSIGRRYGVNPYHIAAANGLYNPDHIYAGQVLLIPAGGHRDGGCDCSPRPYCPCSGSSGW